MIPDYLKNFTSPASIITISVVIGAVVRVLKTEALGNLLDKVPVTWISRIPKSWLPWISVALGVGILTLDAKLNGDLATWKDAAVVGVSGILAGGTAIGGNETIAKVLQVVLDLMSGPKAPPSAAPPTPRVVVVQTPPEKPGTYVRSLRKVAAGMALVLSTASLTACTTLSTLLPHVIAAVVDGQQVVEAIAAFVAKWFLAHPDALLQAKVDAAISKCRSALNVALRTAEGSKDLTESQVGSAFDAFKQAYLELIGLVAPFGVVQSSTALRAAPSGTSLSVPTPLAFEHGAK
jgi:hypothetical protein